MIHVRTLAALALLAAPVLAQDDAELARVRALSDLVEAQDAVPADQRDAAWEDLHQRGLYHLGVALGGLRDDYYKQAGLARLEELAFAAGDGTPMGLHAYVAIADIHASSGNWEEAASFYRAVAQDLLGEPGDTPVRLDPVPALELTRREVRTAGNGSVAEESVVEEPILRDLPIEEVEEPEEPVLIDVPISSDEMLALQLQRNLVAWRTAEPREREQHEAYLRDLSASAVGTTAALRAELVLGDLATGAGKHEEAARHYATIVRSLTGGEAPPTPGR